jgi:hypothetical protein
MLICNLINERYKQYINNLYGKDLDYDLLFKLMLEEFNTDCINYTSCESETSCNPISVLDCRGLDITQDGVVSCNTITITQS